MDYELDCEIVRINRILENIRAIRVGIVDSEPCNDQVAKVMLKFVDEEEAVYSCILRNLRSGKAMFDLGGGGDCPEPKRPRMIDIEKIKSQIADVILYLEELNEECHVQEKKNVFNALFFESMKRRRKQAFKELKIVYAKLDKKVNEYFTDKVSFPLDYSRSRCLQRGKLNNPVPSKCNETTINQDFINYANSAPIGMYSKAFATFRTTQLENIEPEIREKFVKYASKMTIIARDAACGERSHRGVEQDVCLVLQKSFGRKIHYKESSKAAESMDTESGSSRQSESKAASKATSDGYILATNKTGYLLHMEVKPKFEHGLMQSFAYYHRCTSKMENEIDNCHPAVILFLSGYVLFIFGAVFPHQVNINALVRPIDLTKDGANLVLAIVLYALKQLVDELDQYYEGEAIINFPIISNTEELKKVKGYELAPQFMKKVKTTDGEELAVIPVMYTAKYEDQDVVIKFSRTYCVEAHRLCAQNGYSPVIRHYEDNGTYKVTIFDLVVGRKFEDEDKKDETVKKRRDSSDTTFTFVRIRFWRSQDAEYFNTYG